MWCTKTSLWSGKTHSMDLPITPEQIRLWQNGMLIQNVMPQLTPAQREFLISGCTEEEWKEITAGMDEEEV